MTRKEFLNSYKEFLLDNGQTPGSASCYVSYLNCACKEVPSIAHGSHDLIEVMACVDLDTQAYLCELLNTAIQMEKDSGTSLIPLAKLRKYKSSANMLSSFLSSVDGESLAASCKPVKGASVKVTKAVDLAKEDEAITEEKFKEAKEVKEEPCAEIVIDPSKIKSFYSRKDIQDNFKFRLNTQDRFYDYGCLPTRLLEKIGRLRSKSFYIFEKLRDNTRFLYSKEGDKFFRLKEIDGVKIENKRAYVVKDGKEYLIYTEVFKKRKFLGFEPLTAVTLKDLSLDHDVSVFTELGSRIGGYTDYKHFSDIFSKYHSLYPKESCSKISTRFFKDEFLKLDLNLDTLLDEAISFIDILSLTIMQSNYNISKSKVI